MSTPLSLSQLGPKYFAASEALPASLHPLAGHGAAMANMQARCTSNTAAAGTRIIASIELPKLLL